MSRSTIQLRGNHGLEFWGQPGLAVRLYDDTKLMVEDSFRSLIIPMDEPTEGPASVVVNEFHGPDPQKNVQRMNVFMDPPTVCWMLHMYVDGGRFGEPARLITTGANVFRLGASIIKLQFDYRMRAWGLSSAEFPNMLYPPGQIQFIEPAV